MKGKRETRRHRHTANVVLVIMGLFLLAFICEMIALYKEYQTVPDTLIQCVLGTGGAEALVLGGIKIAKVIRGEKTPQEGDEHDQYL